MREAFDETLADPQFLARAREANIYINPMGGQELQAVVGRIAEPSGPRALGKGVGLLREATDKGVQKIGPRDHSTRRRAPR